MATQQSGPVSNDYSGYKLTAVAIVFMVLEGLLVTLRFIARHLARTSWGLDDTFIIPSLVFCWGICILALVMVYACGVGHHASYVLATDPATYISFAKSAVAVEIIYCTSVIFPKISILAMYLRLFPVKKKYRYTIFALMFIVAANGIAGDFTSLLSCDPLKKRWNPTLKGHCINITNYWRFISLANIISDVAMLVFPLPMIWKLHISLPQKVGLTVLFITGSFGLVSSIVRFTIFFRNKAFDDGTWESVDLMTWTLIEPGMYLIAACLPNLRPLWHHGKEKVPSAWISKFSSTSSSHPEVPSTNTTPTARSKYIELGEKYSVNAGSKSSNHSTKEWETHDYRPKTGHAGNTALP